MMIIGEVPDGDEIDTSCNADLEDISLYLRRTLYETYLGYSQAQAFARTLPFVD